MPSGGIDKNSKSNINFCYLVTYDQSKSDQLISFSDASTLESKQVLMIIYKIYIIIYLFIFSTVTQAYPRV